MEKIKELLSYLLMLAIGLSIGLSGKYAWDWYNSEPSYFQMDTKAHFENITNKVVIYTTQWCPYCKKTKAFLNANNIKYTERDIEQGNAKDNLLFKSISSKGVPKIVIGNIIINGFNLPLLKEELKKNQLF